MAHSFPKNSSLSFQNINYSTIKLRKASTMALFSHGGGGLEVNVTSSSAQQETEAEPGMPSTHR